MIMKNLWRLGLHNRFFFLNNYKPSVCVVPWSLSNTHLFFSGHHTTISKDKLYSSVHFNSEILYIWKLIWQTLLKSQASEMSKWVQFSFNCFLNPMCWEKTTEWKLLIKMLTCGTAEPQAGVWHAIPCTDMPTTCHPVLPPSSFPSGIPPPARAETWLDSELHRSDVTFQKAGSLGKPSFRIICHGIILWINWGGHGSPSPNRTVSVNVFAVRSTASQEKNMILLIQGEQRGCWPITNNWIFQINKQFNRQFKI